MKNLFRPLLVLTGCIVLASCVSQKQFKGLKTDYTKLQTEYQESQLQLRENQARSTSLEERLAEAQRNNSELMFHEQERAGGEPLNHERAEHDASL